MTGFIDEEALRPFDVAARFIPARPLVLVCDNRSADTSGKNGK
jgi:hypothetical protein